MPTVARNSTCYVCHSESPPHVRCLCCKRQYHGRCAKLTQPEVDFYTSHTKAKWVCNDCAELLHRGFKNSPIGSLDVAAFRNFCRDLQVSTKSTSKGVDTCDLPSGVLVANVGVDTRDLASVDISVTSSPQPQGFDCVCPSNPLPAGAVSGEQELDDTIPMILGSSPPRDPHPFLITDGSNTRELTDDSPASEQTTGTSVEIPRCKCRNPPPKQSRDKHRAKNCAKHTQCAMQSQENPGPQFTHVTQPRPSQCSQGTNTPRSSGLPEFNRKTLILFNVDESDHPSLSHRASADLSQWQSLRQLLGLPPTSSPSLCRLRAPRSPGDKRPRPLRVTLESADDVEETLLASACLNKLNTKIRAQPDFPWVVREARREARINSTCANHDRACSIIIHGVPELHTADPVESSRHDVQQWCYIRSQLNLSVDNCGAWSVHRLPRPAHLSQIQAPKLLRVILFTPEMRQTVLQRWYELRGNFPYEVRMHPDKPREERRQIQGRNSTPFSRATPSLPITRLVDIPKNE
ncbi:unnamed protein product [Dicrocoelium dendriticum]|nr:unnamed protein product [Dicrocoelium dendriticum]